MPKEQEEEEEEAAAIYLGEGGGQGVAEVSPPRPLLFLFSR